MTKSSSFSILQNKLFDAISEISIIDVFFSVMGIVLNGDMGVL